MGLEQCGLNLDASRRELKAHGTLEFPCAGYLEDYSRQETDNIPWHWHDDLEILYVKDGTLQVQVPAASFRLSAGDCLAISCGILHNANAEPECRLCSLVFNPLLVTGSPDSVFARKYLTPLISCGAFRVYRPDRNGNKEMIRDFLDAFEALAAESPGYEFTIREKLSSFCFGLYRQFAETLTDRNGIPNQDDLRIRKMMDFIQNHYSENITLTEIAESADVGRRECLRCFRRTIQLSPVQYLLKYRIMQGAGQLLSQPSENIAVLSASCGFDSPSYFTKQFRKFFKCSPREYRQKQA